MKTRREMKKLAVEMVSPSWGIVVLTDATSNLTEAFCNCPDAMYHILFLIYPTCSTLASRVLFIHIYLERQP
jgi:hypothetical protein